jgi:hypothetical protein
MATWRDEELPPDETLRVLAGREPTWGFKVKRAAFLLLGMIAGGVSAVFVVLAPKLFGLKSGLMFDALFLWFFIMGIIVGIRAATATEAPDLRHLRHQK